MLRRITLIGVLCLTIAGLSAPVFSFGQDNQGVVGAVYTMTNAAGPNSVVVYNRLSDGTLEPAGMVPTGGSGTGAGLGSQGAIALDNSARWLFVVNAGSDDLSVFSVKPGGLHLRDGTRPDENLEI